MRVWHYCCHICLTHRRRRRQHVVNVVFIDLCSTRHRAINSMSHWNQFMYIFVSHFIFRRFVIRLLIAARTTRNDHNQLDWSHAIKNRPRTANLTGRRWCNVMTVMRCNGKEWNKCNNANALFTCLSDCRRYVVSCNETTINCKKKILRNENQQTIDRKIETLSRGLISNVKHVRRAACVSYDVENSMEEMKFSHMIGLRVSVSSSLHYGRCVTNLAISMRRE